MSLPAENASNSPSPAPAERPLNFIEQMVEADIASGRWGLGKGVAVQTRFPPEPNGYLHVGHAKSICLNYGLAAKFGGKFNLRFDDTNPAKEEQEYVDAIKEDVAWLISAFDGAEAGGDARPTGSEGQVGNLPHAAGGDARPTDGGVFWASDYFGKMYEYAQDLIRKKKAYVCELSAEEVAKRRGTPSVPATSPFRDRPVEESLKLFAEMKEGKHADGSMTLRARIDLASPNFNLRDPVMYRILHEEHHNTGREWCVYAMYDWAHGIEDGLEKVTHSICTLEFENHRPLYDWFIESINEGRAEGDRLWHSQQIEFAKLQFTYTVLSKRNMRRMVEEGFVTGWDDPRMPTISAMRRRGYPAKALRALCEDVGVTKVESVIDIGRLENAVRHELNRTTPRAMCVLKPLKVIIENWPRGADGTPKVDELDFVVNPEDPNAGKRKVKFTGELYIEREDFMEVPEKKFFRLAPGAEVRLRWAYFIKCVGVEKDAAGNVVAVRCTYDPETRGGDAPHGPDGKPIRKVKGTLHWVSASEAVGGEVRLYDRLFAVEAPGEKTGKWEDDLNAASLEVLHGAKLDPVLASAKVGETFQFERMGYFCADRESAEGKPVFTRTVTLKESK